MRESYISRSPDIVVYIYIYIYAWKDSKPDKRRTDEYFPSLITGITVRQQDRHPSQRSGHDAELLLIPHGRGRHAADLEREPAGDDAGLPGFHPEDDEAKGR